MKAVPKPSPPPPRSGEGGRGKAKEPSPLVRGALASTTSDPKIMESLLEDESPWVRLSLASNPHIPEEIQMRLVGRGEPEVLRVLAKNENLNEGVARALLTKFPEILNPAFWPSRKAFLEGAGRVVSRGSRFPEVAEALLFSEIDPALKLRVLEAPLPPEVLVEYLKRPWTRGEEEVVDEAYALLAKEPTLDPEAEELLVRLYPFFARGEGTYGSLRKKLALARAQSLNPKAAELLAEEKALLVADALSERRDLPKRAQERLVENPLAANVLAAKSPSIDTEVQKRILALRWKDPAEQMVARGKMDPELVPLALETHDPKLLEALVSRYPLPDTALIEFLESPWPRLVFRTLQNLPESFSGDPDLIVRAARRVMEAERKLDPPDREALASVLERALKIAEEAQAGGGGKVDPTVAGL